MPTKKQARAGVKGKTSKAKFYKGDYFMLEESAKKAETQAARVNYSPIGQKTGVLLTKPKRTTTRTVDKATLARL